MKLLKLAGYIGFLFALAACTLIGGTAGGPRTTGGVGGRVEQGGRVELTLTPSNLEYFRKLLSWQIDWVQILLSRSGVEGPVSLSLEGNPLLSTLRSPDRIAWSFTPNPVVVGDQSTLTLWVGQGIPFGQYTLTLRAQAAGVEVGRALLELRMNRGGEPPLPEPGATPADARPVSGLYIGRYACSQGPTGVDLLVQGTPEGFVTARFDFYSVQENLGVPSGSFLLQGRYFSDGSLLLRPERWIRQPSGYFMVSVFGKVYSSPNGLIYRGFIPECQDAQGGTFSAVRR